MNGLVSTNSAQRASVFLSGFVAASGGDTSHKVRDALASMYDLPAEDTSSLMMVIADAWTYPVRIREDLEKTGLDPSPFNHIFEDLERFLSMLALNSISSSVKNNIPTGLLASLGVLSAFLNKDSPEPLLERKNIDELIRNLNTLRKEIKSAGFKESFTDYLLHNISGLEYALNHYETLGADRVIARVDAIFGAVFRQYGEANSKSKKNVLGHIMKTAYGVVLMMNLANGGFELSENLNLFIESSTIKNGQVIENNTIDGKGGGANIA